MPHRKGHNDLPVAGLQASSIMQSSELLRVRLGRPGMRRRAQAKV